MKSIKSNNEATKKKSAKHDDVSLHVTCCMSRPSPI